MSVTTSVRDGIGRLILDHPPLNILTRAVLSRLREELAGLAARPELRVLVLTARGEHFSAGADVGEHLPPHHRELIPEFMETVRAMESFPLPIIAAVRGRCLGGGFELIQPADLIVASRSARFGQPEIRLGVIAPAACALLPRAGRAAAAAALYTGDTIAAEDAARIGWVWRVVPEDELEDAALDLAGRIARNSPAALRAAKRAVRAGGAEVPSGLDAAERIYLEELMSTRDALEGLRAFVEKREPQWTGR